MHNWKTFEDIVEFSLHLPSEHRTGFMIAFSALCWVAWKHRNDICSNNSSIKTPRSLILLIKSLVLYWTGNIKRKQQCTTTKEWMPVVEDAIPLDQYMPLEIVVYQPPPGSSGQE